MLTAEQVREKRAEAQGEVVRYAAIRADAMRRWSEALQRLDHDQMRTANREIEDAGRTMMAWRWTSDAFTVVLDGEPE